MKCIKCDTKFVAARVELCNKCKDSLLSEKQSTEVDVININELAHIKEENIVLKAEIKALVDSLDSSDASADEAVKVVQKIKDRLTTKNIKKGNVIEEIAADLRVIIKLIGVTPEEVE